MIARRLRILAILCLCTTPHCSAHAADDKTWSNASYTIQLHVAIDSSANPGVVGEQLIPRIEQLVHRNLYPYWKCHVTKHEGTQRSLLLRQLAELDQRETDFQTDAELVTDKILFLTVTVAGGAINLACREHDMLTGRWTPVIEREVRQPLLLPQNCFELLCETFCPRALVEVTPQDDGHAAMVFRGEALLAPANRSLLARPQSVFQPYLMRTSRSGASVGKVIEVPWTYLVLEESTDDAWQAAVFSGSRRPFGARRRAGVDIVALELKPAAGDTFVRFHAAHDPEQALSGYEVFEKAANESEFRPAGFTDANGRAAVQRGDFPVMLLVLRAEAQPLVQVPVVPGAVAELQIPVSDDVARLRVQEALTTFREQMVDVVARRNILMARARDQLQKGKQQQAKDLLDKIGDLPTRANMDRYLATLERDPASQSENPRVQAKIDRMFADSRKMMSTYLTARELRDLETEVNRSTVKSSD